MSLKATPNNLFFFLQEIINRHENESINDSIRIEEKNQKRKSTTFAEEEGRRNLEIRKSSHQIFKEKK